MVAATPVPALHFDQGVEPCELLADLRAEQNSIC